MAKKTEERMARVRYEAENLSKNISEGFVLELWDNENEEWSFSSKATCHKAEDHPEDVEKNFIHFTFMREIIRCVDLGYSIYYTS